MFTILNDGFEVWTIDYRWEGGRPLVSASYVTISNPDPLSCSETGGLSWNKKLKIAFIWLSSISEIHLWFLFHKEAKSWEPAVWFIFYQFQSPAWNRYLQIHLLAECFVSWGWWLTNARLAAPISPLNSSTFLLSSHLWSTVWTVNSWHVPNEEEDLEFCLLRGSGFEPFRLELNSVQRYNAPLRSD